MLWRVRISQPSWDRKPSLVKWRWRAHPILPFYPSAASAFTDIKNKKWTLAEPQTYQAILTWFSQLAKRYQTAIVAGSLPALSADQNKLFNRTLVFNALATLFSVMTKFTYLMPSCKPKFYQESRTYVAGNKVAVAEVAGVKFGVAICYDVRFPELFQALRLQGAEVIAIPAAFAAHTGQHHWQPLLQARAIETQCHIGASAQAAITRTKEVNLGTACASILGGKSPRKRINSAGFRRLSI